MYKRIITKLAHPDLFTKKVNVIKAIRVLSGLGLKESKEGADDMQQGKSFTFESNGDLDALSIMKSFGVVVVGEVANPYIRDVRNVAIRAIRNSDYMVAKAIMNLLVSIDPEGK